VFGLSTLSTIFGGPISTYYLTAGDQGMIWAVQGNSVVNSWTQHFNGNGGEYTIAIPSNIRTLGNGNSGQQGPGSGYTLGGAFNGNIYTYPVPGVSFYDGASDGTHNYAVDPNGNGTVYQTDASWANAVALFSIGTGFLGITYDATNNSLWISNFAGTGVRDYSLAGALLSSFSTPFYHTTSLAMDPADNTLWMGSQLTPGTFYQYSRLGVQLSTATYGSLANQNTIGGEFAFTVPEPSAMVMLLVAFAVLLAFRRARS
jgi:hypothetical protein